MLSYIKLQKIIQNKFKANPNPCQLPMSTGEGFAQLERFYYDSASKTCKSFFYKGLKGNQNNFLNLVN